MPKTSEFVLAPAFERLVSEQHPIALARDAVLADASLNPKVLQLWRDLHDGGWLGLGTEAMRAEAMPELARMGEASGRSLLSVPFAFTSLVLAPLVEATPSLADEFLTEPLDAGPISGRIDLGGSAGPLLFDYVGPRAGYYQLASSGSTIVLRRFLAASHPVAGLDAGVPVLDFSEGHERKAAERRLDLQAKDVLRLLQPFFVFQYGHLLGAAAAALDSAIAYAKERRQFGRAIGEFQAVKHSLANAWVALDNARYAVNALAQADSTETVQRLVGITDRLVAAGAKLATRVTIQVHGAIGFAWEHDAHLYLKRVYKSSAQMTHIAGQLAAADLTSL
ncbi:acyl-CoA dehydrogenase family protein [Alicycliphilus denitrificans]|nr:acyl-CoA dehydrogenase family protein [Alicycliphilus denitrificans]